MIKKVIAAAALLVLTTVAIVNAMGSGKENQTKTGEGIEIGQTAPDFELKTLSGEKAKLSDYKGKKVLVNFWATWCPPCKAEMPAMQKLSENAGNDLVILAVNIDPQFDVAAFAKEWGITFPILLDEKDEVNSTYKILTIPTTYFIDRNGIIQYKHNGAMTLEQMEQYTKAVK